MKITQIDAAWVQAHLPTRSPEAGKHNYGRVVALCGCPLYRGAAALSATAALRVGAGLVTMAAPECVLQSVLPMVPEATVLPLPDDERLAALLAKADVVLAGCGKEHDAAVTQEMCFAAARTNGTLVLDAGGLVAMRHQTELFPAGRTIITPHLGEAAAITGLTVEEIRVCPAEVAATLAKTWQCVVVLKQHRTMIAAPDGTVLENTTGNDGLATGGSGDVLAGMIAGLAAQHIAPLEAAACGVWLHGRAADLCAQRLSVQSMLPHDILSYLGRLFTQLTPTAQIKENT